MANNTKPKTKGKTKKYYPKEKTLKALTKKVNKLTKEVQGEKKYYNREATHHVAL